MTSDDELRAFLRARIPIGTQAAVARAAGLSPGRLSRYLAGFGSMRLAKLIPLLAHVGGTLTLTGTIFNDLEVRDDADLNP